MAAAPERAETPFALLLRADSEHPLSDNDADVKTALTTYGATFKKTLKDAPARLELMRRRAWNSSPVCSRFTRIKTTCTRSGLSLRRLSNALWRPRSAWTTIYTLHRALGSP